MANRKFTHNRYTIERVAATSNILMITDTDDGSMLSIPEPRPVGRKAALERQRQSLTRQIERIDAVDAFLDHENEVKERATRTT